MIMLLLGFLIGTAGTLIGVGGGFLLIPILLYAYPEKNNIWVSSISMWVVAWNASSGSIAYLRQRRVHLRSACIFILASLPGSVLGVWAEGLVSRGSFETIFGGAMVLYALVIFFKGAKQKDESSMHPHSTLDFKVYLQGSLISFFVGFVASFFGIGGGVVHVPLLTHMLGFPVHMATGTSHFILALTAWFTTLVHLYNGDISLSDPMLWQLAAGAVVGAQLGARLSGRVSGNMILKLLAVALVCVGLRLLIHR